MRVRGCRVRKEWRSRVSNEIKLAATEIASGAASLLRGPWLRPPAHMNSWIASTCVSFAILRARSVPLLRSQCTEPHAGAVSHRWTAACERHGKAHACRREHAVVHQLLGGSDSRLVYRQYQGGRSDCGSNVCDPIGSDTRGASTGFLATDGRQLPILPGESSIWPACTACNRPARHRTSFASPASPGR